MRQSIEQVEVIPPRQRERTTSAVSSVSPWLPDLAGRPDARLPDAIGRHARLELVFELRRGRTVLAHAYAEPPFRVGRAFQLDDAAYMILGCTGPGIFAGDTLRQSIRVASGARVVLVSQSALQVHPAAAAAPASIAHDYVVEDEGELHCQWDPVIPFALARLEQRFAISLAASSRLCWGDAIMAGRVRRGEAWRFESLAHELRLNIAGSLTYLERYVLAPSDRQVEQRWLAGEARYLATALVHHEGATADAAEALQSATPEGAIAGVDLIGPATLVARIMAHDGAPFARARAAFLTQAQGVIFGTPSRTARK
jgi:urease accessory protein UreH